MSPPSKASILIRWLETCWKELVESYYHEYELPMRIIRPPNAHGLFQTTSIAGSLVSIFRDYDVAGKLFIIHADETQTRSLSYVTDCTGLTAEATLSDKMTDEALIVISSNSFTDGVE